MKATHGMVRMGTKIGAAVGVVAFLAFGLIPAFYFGSYGALTVMSHLMGSPLEPSVLVRVATAFGILLGIACTGFLSIVVGSILGTTVGYAAEAVASAAREKAPEETAQVKAE